MRWVFFGLSLSSSWGNGHATTYRGLLRGLKGLGHQIVFFEKDVPWYASHRDLPHPQEAELYLYQDWPAIRPFALARIAVADAVVVGSYFPDAVELLNELLAAGHPPLAFYDIDTPVTLETLNAGSCEYLRREHLGQVDLYLSFTGGPVLHELVQHWGARAVAPLYCACDPGDYASQAGRHHRPVLLNYMGTFSPDRQGKLQRYFLEPARRMPVAHFALAGPMYPDVHVWPHNVHYCQHLAPDQHAAFYQSSRFTLNLTRQAMVEAGYSPSVRLFEAACAASPVISDPWPGLEDFFEPGREIFVAEDACEIMHLLQSTSAAEARLVGIAARRRMLAYHTGSQRAAELACYFDQLRRHGKLLHLHQSAQTMCTASALPAASFQLTDGRRN